MVVFQQNTTVSYKNYLGTSMNYNNSPFTCPYIFAKDGFFVSLQISRRNYCTSNEGYQQLGHTMIDVEFGFPSEYEELLEIYAEQPESLLTSVGRVPVSVMETIFEKHGGIDWEKTISIERWDEMVAKESHIPNILSPQYEDIF